MVRAANISGRVGQQLKNRKHLYLQKIKSGNIYEMSTGEQKGEGRSTVMFIIEHYATSDIMRENITNRLRLWTVASDSGPADLLSSGLLTGNGKKS